MEKETVKDRAQQQSGNIENIKWTANNVAVLYLNNKLFFDLPMFSLWSPEEPKKPGDVRILPDGLEKKD